MVDLPTSITLAIALLAAFFIILTALQYAIRNAFVRTRILMTALFLFIIGTLSISFWPYGRLTLPYTIPALVIGIALGYNLGVKAERHKLMTQGIEHYMEHFAHIHSTDLKRMTWWSVVNFYSIMCGLVLINLIGFTNVILQGSPLAIVATSVVGALFIGSIIPYLAHLWSVPVSDLARSEHQGEHHERYERVKEHQTRPTPVVSSLEAPHREAEPYE